MDPIESMRCGVCGERVVQTLQYNILGIHSTMYIEQRVTSRRSSGLRTFGVMQPRNAPERGPCGVAKEHAQNCTAGHGNLAIDNSNHSACND